MAVFDEGGLVFELESRVCHELNATGAQILMLLNGSRDVREVIQAFALKCGQPAKALRKDFDIFFDSLIDRGWVYVKRK